jgi:AcrR family transcriptional regulator
MIANPSRSSSHKRSPGRPRSDEARQSILESTLELLQKTGFEALSIEGIAAHAGVGKATVYRWWPNKAAVVIDAFLTWVEPELQFPKAPTVREQIMLQMRRLTRLMRGQFGTVLAAIIGAGQSQPEMLEAIRTKWLEPRRKEARLIVQQAQRRGELRSDISADTILDILYAPLYFRLMIGHADVDLTLVDAVFAIASCGLDDISIDSPRHRRRHSTRAELN